ncbi:MAG: hypothetical protein K0R10_2378 [Alphaproteobacteria bacterium]|jgi:uncharacterized protein YegJ (DUF2314 family)|nr:hypothetical protein [Alphaproteobacteria bacterium]
MPSTGVILTILAIAVALFLIREHFLLWKGSKQRRQLWVQFKPDDPLILAAAEKARALLPLFDSLREKYPRFSSLALGPIQEDGDTTPVLVRRKVPEGYMVCRAKNKKDGTATEVGEEFLAKTEDIVDWIVYESEKKDRIYGGYTLRAVVEIAERDGFHVPPPARRQFEKFVDA